MNFLHDSQDMIKKPPYVHHTQYKTQSRQNQSFSALQARRQSYANCWQMLACALVIARRE